MLTFSLVFAIINRSQLIEVLHFHKTPLLDRNLLAIVLRACPHVKMLGIYECPMLHLGDVIFLLDLIHEVNLERDKQNLPHVETLDFYPRYHAGMPYKSDWEFETYGFSWKCQNNDRLQRGVLEVVMLAVLKSREMKIGLLMDENAAFMTYLSNIPMVPGKVFAFLDGLYRYLDLKASKSKDEGAIMQAMYDLVKAVRGGLEPLKKDWPRYYLDKMGKRVAFCCSCGYELLNEFFSNDQINLQSHIRHCSACILRCALDEEEDHLKLQTQGIMAGFYPDWNPADFNLDAPILAEGRDLIRLKTTKAVRDPAPSMILLPDGEFYQPPHAIEFVRDQKFHFDSVQGLPTLATLLKADGLRQKARDAALIADAKRALSLVSLDLYPDLFLVKPTPALIRMVTAQGVPDHYDEGQGRPPARRPGYMRIPPTHTFNSAVAMYKTLDEPCKDVFRTGDDDDEDEGDDFWTPNGKVKEGFW